MAELAPIAILAFNRTDYLTEVLDSLKAQEGAAIHRRPVILFQDGAFNPYSKIQRTTPEIIAENLKVFQERIPRGVAVVPDYNLGIALNFDRAERFFFESNEYPAAIFLEDDLVLSPHYIATVDRLLAWAKTDERIGYVAGYGSLLAPLEVQKAAEHALVQMNHNWGFGLTRRQWLKMKPYIDEYLKHVRGIDYGQRNHQAIADLFYSWGYGCPGSSQDVCKAMAMQKTGAVKVMPRVCLGRYIGAEGTHMTPERFQKQGFADTVLYPEKPRLKLALSDKDYQTMLSRHGEWCMALTPWLKDHEGVSPVERAKAEGRPVGKPRREAAAA